MTPPKKMWQEITKRWLAGGTQAELATVFGTTQTTISRICRVVSGLRPSLGERGSSSVLVGAEGSRVLVHRSTGESVRRYHTPKDAFVPQPNPRALATPFELMPREAERFWAKVKKASGDGCWTWNSNRGPTGYGNAYEYDKVNKKSRANLAHRVAWRLTYGPIPPKRIIGHRCDNPPCCRPSHLFVCTYSENMRDMVTKGRGRKGSKLDWSKVKEIRRLRERTGWTMEAIAEKFGIAYSQVANVVHYRQWKLAQPPKLE